MGLLDLLKDLTLNIQRLRKEDERRQAIPRFMDGMGELGLHLAQNPGDRDADSLKKFVAATTETWKSAAAHVDLIFGTNLENLLNSSFEADEWQTACRRRTALETVNELYQDAGEDFQLDAEDIDDALRRRAAEEATPPKDARALQTPESHWWWRLGA